VELQQHCPAGDLPPLGLLDDGAGAQQSAAQPDGVLGGAGLLVLPDEEGDQPTEWRSSPGILAGAKLTFGPPALVGSPAALIGSPASLSSTIKGAAARRRLGRAGAA